MNSSRHFKDTLFTRFDESVDTNNLPTRFTNPFNYKPHPLCIIAAKEIQRHLVSQKEWIHNFGLEEGMEGDVVGKMFGVLVARNREEEIGYLAAFSGSLAGANHHSGFVPPIFDGLVEGGFMRIEMAEMSQIGWKIKTLEERETIEARQDASKLKEQRKAQAKALTDRLFEQYNFLNQAGEKKNVAKIFKDALNIKPPGGAGECAAPKLLHYAFHHKMKPIAMAEFFWGLSRGSDYWQHKKYYPACREKCEPILGFMLKGMELE